MRNALNSYSQVSLEAQVASATPLQLVLMLYDGALKAIAIAKYSLQKKEVGRKGESISKAIAIIDEGLKLSLDHQSGGEISRNLSDLYEYMCHRLLHANIHNDVEALDEVAKLLRELRDAWDEIGKMGQSAKAVQPPVMDEKPTQRSPVSYGKA